MKRIITIIIACVLSANAFAGAGKIINQKITDASGASITVKWSVDDTHCKLEMQYTTADVNSLTTFLPDMKSMKLLMWAVGGVTGAGSNPEKKYSSLPAAAIQPNNEIAKVNRVGLVHTGETKSISGFTCERVQMRTNNSSTEMWVTKDWQPEFYRFMPFFRSDWSLLGLNEERIKGFALSSETRDISGKVIAASEVISVTSANFTEADFATPEGWTEAK